MKRVTIDSSNIKAVGYDAQAKEMHVEFKSGAIYAHYGVDPVEHARFITSDSRGRHYAQTFRNKFDIKKIKEPPK